MLKKITAGSTISIIAPAFSANQAKVTRGVKYLEKKGYIVRQTASVNSNWRYFSAEDEQRAADINDSFADNDVSAIICARGGWGSLRLLNLLDYKRIKDNPKILIGYSDITTLQLAIWARCKVPSFSGPMVAVEMATKMSPITEQSLWNQINNNEKNYIIRLEELSGTTFLKAGEANGPLIGGCLSLVAHILGTPYCPSFENAILFLEDIGEDIYKIDRYLAHLSQAGIFKRLSGLIIGQFNDCEDNTKPNFTILELFEYYSRHIEGPVLFNFPYGHGKEKITMPIGANSQISHSKKIVVFENLFR